ncbi:hypothetical protein Tco_0620934, partial [Tanacetum coccineum]
MFGIFIVVGGVSSIFKLSFVIVDSFSCYWSFACPDVLEEDGEQIHFLGGNSSSGTKKYQGLNSNDGGNTRDGVKIAGGVIGSGDEIVEITVVILVMEDVPVEKIFLALIGAKDCCLIWVIDKRVGDENEVKSMENSKMNHLCDGRAWKYFDMIKPEFSGDPRNVRLGLAADGFNPFGMMSQNYSMCRRRRRVCGKAEPKRSGTSWLTGFPIRI